MGKKRILMQYWLLIHDNLHHVPSHDVADHTARAREVLLGRLHDVRTHLHQLERDLADIEGTVRGLPYHVKDAGISSPCVLLFKESMGFTWPVYCGGILGRLRGVHVNIGSQDGEEFDPSVTHSEILEVGSALSGKPAEDDAFSNKSFSFTANAIGGGLGLPLAYAGCGPDLSTLLAACSWIRRVRA